MGDQRYWDLAYGLSWEQRRPHVAYWLGKPITMADMDHIERYLGAHPLQRSAVDNLLSESFQVAKGGKAEMGINDGQPLQGIAPPGEPVHTAACAKNANDTQVGGNHYRGRNVQHWDYAWQLPYLEGAATAYLDRHREKGGKQDLQKAIHFIQKMIEVYYPDPK